MDLFELFYDYPFDNILENSINISFIEAYYDFEKNEEKIILDCIIYGNFSHENNISIKNDINYKTFFNNVTINWEIKDLVINRKYDNIKTIYLCLGYIFI